MTRNGKFRWRDSWKNMQNWGSYEGERWMRSNNGFFSPTSRKKTKRNGKIMRVKTFPLFFLSQLFGARISLTIATKSLQWNSDYPWFILSLFVQLCRWEIHICGGKWWKTLCDLYANFEGKSWITLELNLIINSVKSLKIQQA